MSAQNTIARLRAEVAAKDERIDQLTKTIYALGTALVLSEQELASRPTDIWPLPGRTLADAYAEEAAKLKAQVAAKREGS